MPPIRISHHCIIYCTICFHFQAGCNRPVLRCKIIALTYKNIYNNRYSSAVLSDHAARKSGNARRKPGTGFSDAISRALSRFAAQNSESEKNAIERIFHSFIQNMPE